MCLYIAYKDINIFQVGIIQFDSPFTVIGESFLIIVLAGGLFSIIICIW